jgi:hypothetical protein
MSDDRANSPKRARQGAAGDDENVVDELAELRALLEAERRARVAEAEARAAAESRANAEAQARTVAEANAAIAEKARAVEAKARAEEAKARAVEARERAVAETARKAERMALSRCRSGRVVCRVAFIMAAPTRPLAMHRVVLAIAAAFRHPALTEIDVAIQALVSLRDPGASFWSTLPLTDAATVDRICAATRCRPDGAGALRRRCSASRGWQRDRAGASARA